jgi:hypothetical protein
MLHESPSVNENLFPQVMINLCVHIHAHMYIHVHLYTMYNHAHMHTFLDEITDDKL